MVRAAASFNVVDLVDTLETETRAGRHGRIADHLTRLDFVVLDELGYPRRRQGALEAFGEPHETVIRNAAEEGMGEALQLHSDRVNRLQMRISDRKRPCRR
ncbi:hypothetical protein [Mesorhizobium sp. M1112]|uniref:hypothetical protein n=1 Tax=unclassified Mesorhizobium TaxID=325217 RepID=UPI00333D03C9